MFESQKWYGIMEVAEMLGRSRKTIWAMYKDGRLPPVHGGCRRFRGDQLKLWAEQGEPWRDIEDEAKQLL